MLAVDTVDCTIIHHDEPLYKRRRKASHPLRTIELHFGELSEEKRTALRSIGLGVSQNGEVLIPATCGNPQADMFFDMISRRLPVDCIASVWDFTHTRQMAYIDIVEAKVAQVVSYLQDAFTEHNISYISSNLP